MKAVGIRAKVDRSDRWMRSDADFIQHFGGELGIPPG
jgi:hypothetical protein